jgi:hypothetical protein
MKNKKSDELLQVAFDIDEKVDIPDDYVLDDLHDESIQFLKNTKSQGIACLSRVRNTKEVEYSLNVNNNKSYIDIYDRLGITEQWKILIKNEFESLGSYIQGIKVQNKVKLSVDEITSKYRLHRENIKAIQIPSQEDIEKLSMNMSNRLCITLIKILMGIYQAISASEDDYKLCMWIYYVLLMIQLPLVDEDNSIIYKLNKLIYSKGMGSINSKLLFVIISEIFRQKIVL